MCDAVLRPEYLFTDPPYDPSAAPADYDMLCVESGGAALYGEIMWPDGAFRAPRPCVLLLHGYPGVARNDDLAFALRRIGCVVLTPHHRGAWGSQGEYLISSCVEDAVRLCEYVRSAEFCGRYHTDPDAVFLMGHSMGGSSTLQAARRVRALRGAVLLAPYDPTCFLRRGEKDELLTLLRTGYILHGGGIDAVLTDIQDHLGEYGFDGAYEDVKDQNLCCITGTLDTIAPAWMVTPLWERLLAHETTAIQRLVELPAAHGLCGCRTALIQTVADFLCDVLRCPPAVRSGQVR